MIRTSSVLVLAFVVALGLSGAGVVRAATPSIRSIGPSVISVGDPDFSLRVQGENFDKTAVVLLDGVPLETQFVSKSVCKPSSRRRSRRRRARTRSR